MWSTQRLMERQMFIQMGFTYRLKLKTRWDDASFFVCLFSFLCASIGSHSIAWLGPTLNKISVLHSHSVGELLKCLAVKGDGHTCICVKGELHSVLNLWFFTVLHRCVRVIFIPAARRLDNTSSTQPKLLWYFHWHSCSVVVSLYLTKRRESFRMLTRLLRVFTGSWGAGVTYGNCSNHNNRKDDLEISGVVSLSP